MATKSVVPQGVFVHAFVVLLGGLTTGMVTVDGEGRPTPTRAMDGRAEVARPARQQVLENYGKLPVSFEPNRGQTHPAVKFLSRGRSYSLFLTSSEAVMVLRQPQGQERPVDPPAGAERQTSTTAAVLHMRPVGANPAPKIVATDELSGKSHYFVDKSPEKWLRNVPTYARVVYREVYPEIDLAYYGRRGQIEYDFIVRAGGDPETIALAFEGADSMALDAEGDLVLNIGGAEVRQKKPYIYQEIAGARREVAGGYVLKAGRRVGFRVGDYDPRRSLVIDPVLLAYSTYLGGSHSEFALGIAVDGTRSAYVTGQTASADFPTTAGALQSSFAGGSADVFVSKLDPEGSTLVYSTFLGGGAFDAGFDLSVEGSGTVYVTGQTASLDFPTTPGAFQPSFGGGSADAFVSKLGREGSELLYSTYLGGGQLEFGFDIAVRAGNAYVTGRTFSADFPATPGAFQTLLAGVADAFVTKLDRAGSALVYSTYLGGGNADFGLGIAVDGAGSAYVTGWTLSADFPTTAAAVQPGFAGGEDAFVSKLDRAGSALAYSTYLGGSDLDRGIAIALDGAGRAYVTGPTQSADFPTTEEAFQPVFGGGLNDAFVSKLDRNGSTLAYSTYLGGSNVDVALDIAVRAGSAYVTGQTVSPDFPTTPGVFQPEFAGGGHASMFNGDAFVSRLDRQGSTLVYSTYLGGSDTDLAHGIAVDGVGSAYISGQTFSADFPATAGAFQPVFGGGSTDAFVAKVVEAP